MNNIILISAGLLVLWLGKNIFIPIMIAVFVWYLINSISAYYRKILPFKNFSNKHKIFTKIFDYLSFILAVISFSGLIFLFITQIKPMFSELIIAMPEIQTKLINFSDYISKFIGFSFDSNILPNFSSAVNLIGTSLAGIATTFGMVLIYVLFMFIEQNTFNKKIDSLFPNKIKLKKVQFIIKSIDENMKKYMFMKTFISSATGILSYIWLSHIGLEFAGIWAFIIFIMNYIPTFGSIVACSLPILYSFVSFDSMKVPILTAFGLITIQIFLGNILEPKLTGKTLNISTLAILINLVFWSMLWGVAGMFFSVPMLVAIFIITAQFDSLRFIAILLSANGEIPDKDE